ncbi:MAG TPA: trans-2-enoyl-CoA reductase family protein [Anaerolineae bacterium]|nr:trans-2-enoyl-CoA reductase family protein [Anaerolineae bacterium]HRA19575.1 trans-2-enoyl-CoA reductase family protein [Anaerolineae bacterium]
MPEQVVQPRIRGFVCTTAHPGGCAVQVSRQAAQVRRDPAAWSGGNLLVLGSSTGYGLATRVTGAFRYGMSSLGVCFERPPKGDRTASAGWYNTGAFHGLTRAAGLKAETLNGDAFSNEVLAQTMDRLREGFGPVDLLVYSLAAPKRQDPETGQVYQSVLKTVGRQLPIKTVNLNTEEVEEVALEVATPQEISDTVAVMGGADLRRWVEALLAAGLLAPGARVVAYSYLGPEVTWPIYRHGTIGHAKADLEVTCASLNETLAKFLGGGCYVSINKSIVTQASAAIPAVPLYMSLLFDVMTRAGTHEGPLEQAVRLLADHLGPGLRPTTDDEGRIRLDDLEMTPAVQAEVLERWSKVTTERLAEWGSFARFQRYFRQCFGFDVAGVDYTRPVETDLGWD